MSMDHIKLDWACRKSKRTNVVLRYRNICLVLFLFEENLNYRRHYIEQRSTEQFINYNNQRSSKVRNNL